MDRIANFMELSLIDWDGVLSSVVFLSGCPWRCPYCHNSDLWEVKRGIPEDKFFEYLKKRKNWIEGVVILGGEPLIGEDVIPFARKIKNWGLRVKIDTNGSKPEILKKLMAERLVDFVAMDVKTRLTGEKYDRAAGIKNVALEKVKKSMEILFAGGVSFELRTTMVPEIVDKEDLIYNLKFIPGKTSYVLQQFSPDNVPVPHFRSLSPYSEDYIKDICEELKDRGLAATVRGEQ
ncbi:MAG: anaerobic ribonucleoside-triphosphate reductase activating protein [Elusimicrobia bacterium]|nr:anaerobic ribonucleoside-triphosphate reductase activating protein [Elusimicrobiota bacterium]